MRIASVAFLLLAVATAPAGAQRTPVEPPIDSLTRWARRDSLDARAAFALGMGYWRRRRFEQADLAFQRALQLAPHYAEPLLAAAVLPYGRGARYLTDLAHRISADSMDVLDRRAARWHRQAYLLDPMVDPRILRHLPIDQLVPRRTLGGSEGANMLAPPPLWWERRAKQGVAALIEGHAESSFVLLDSVLNAPRMRQGATLPDIFIWYYGLAAAHAGRFDHAAAAFLELSQRTYRRQQAIPDWVIPASRADYLYLYGVMSERAGVTEVAIAALQEALDADFGLFEAHAHLADIHEARGDIARAVAERTRAINVEPGSAKLHLDLGTTLLRAGDGAAAESAFEEAARLLPNDPDVQHALATTALRNGHTDQAKAAFERFIAVAPARCLSQVADARHRLAELP